MLTRDLFEGWEESDEIEIRLLFQWWAHKNSNLGPLINSPNYDFDLAFSQSGTTTLRRLHLKPLTKVVCRPHINVRANSEPCPMWLHIQTWLSLLTIGLTITICFGIVSLMKGLSHSK